MLQWDQNFCDQKLCECYMYMIWYTFADATMVLYPVQVSWKTMRWLNLK